MEQAGHRAKRFLRLVFFRGWGFLVHAIESNTAPKKVIVCLNCIQGSWAWCQPEVTLRIQITSRVDQVDHLKQKVYGERKATPINRQVGLRTAREEQIAKWR